MQNNPYQAPGSDLGRAGDGKRSVLWKIYFFFITLLSGFGILLYFFDANTGPAEYISAIFWLVSTVGLFGFAFVRAVYRPEFWLKFLVAYIVYSVLYYFVTDLDLSAGMTDTVFYISTAIAWLIVLPAYYALYLYGKPGDIAWKRDRQA